MIPPTSTPTPPPTPIQRAIPLNSRLTFLNVSHQYNTVTALNNFNLDVGNREVVCVLGPSGCGKSTLLRAAAGVLQPTSGRIFVDGREMSGSGVFVPAEQRGVGLVFQDYALFPHMTVMKNVLFGLAHLDKYLARQEARAALARVEMLDYADAYPMDLSGGEQQRVALARATAPKPAVLLMDEPFSGLDRRLRAQTRYQTIDLIKQVGASSVIVTHDPEEAALTADRIVVMRAGCAVQTGTPSDIFEYPIDAATARFVTEVNEFDGVVRGGAVDTPFGKMPASQSDGSEVTLMFRPAALAFGHGADGVHDARGGSGDQRYSQCTAAQVLDVRWLGGEFHVELKVDNIDSRVRMRRRLTELPALGDTVKICVEWSQVWCFPALKQAA